VAVKNHVDAQYVIAKLIGIVVHLDVTNLYRLELVGHGLAHRVFDMVDVGGHFVGLQFIRAFRSNLIPCGAIASWNCAARTSR
jgi:hypothetical protein